MRASQEYSGRSSTHFIPGESAYVICRRGGDRPPALQVRLGEGAAFVVALDAESEIAEGQMRFAQDLHAASQAYLVECERLRAAARASGPPRRVAQHALSEDGPTLVDPVTGAAARPFCEPTTDVLPRVDSNH